MLDLKNINPANIVDMGDGKQALKIGELVNPEIISEMDMAQVNGGLVLYATTSIEKWIESILLVYFMGPFIEPNPRRDMFEREVLESSTLTFSSKKELLFKAVNEEDLIKGKSKNKLQGSLKRIMEWRNAFAHGRVQHELTKGVVLKYYSGKPCELILNDEYWSGVEETFRETEKILKEIKKGLENA